MAQVGYDQGIFMNQLEAVNYICTICQDVLNNPVICPEGCELCKSCVSNYISANTKNTRNKSGTILCPNCKSCEFEKGKFHFNRRSRQDIETLQTKCRNSDNAFPCPWQGTVLNYEQHIANCPMEASNCQACELRCCFDGCNGIILRRDSDLHFEVTLDRVIDKVRDVNEQNDTLRAQVCVLVAENIDFKVREVVWQNELRDFKSSVAALKSEVCSYEVEVGALNSQSSVQGLEATYLCAEVDACRAKVVGLNCAYKVREAALEREVRDYQAKVKECENGHKSQVSALEAEIGSLKAQLSAQKLEVTGLIAEIHGYQEKVTDLNAKIGGYITQLSKVNTHVARLVTEVRVSNARLSVCMCTRQGDVGEKRKRTAGALVSSTAAHVIETDGISIAKPTSPLPDVTQRGMGDSTAESAMTAEDFEGQGLTLESSSIVNHKKRMIAEPASTSECDGQHQEADNSVNAQSPSVNGGPVAHIPTWSQRADGLIREAVRSGQRLLHFC